MTTDTKHPGRNRNGGRTPPNGDATISPTTIFDLLSHSRRRLALYSLVRTVGALELDDLAERIAIAESDRESDDRIATSLAHVHLPKLAEAGVVGYDPDNRTVEALAPVDALCPYLWLAEPADVGPVGPRNDER